MAQQGAKSIPRHSYSSPFFSNTDASDHNCLSISNGPGAMSQTWVLSQRRALSNVLRRKLDFLSSPAILRQEFITVFPVCDPLLLPHLSLAANTQLLGYLSRAPIKGCHSGLQCPWANHIRAPAHALPLLCCSSPAILITFKYFHRWPISCLRGEHIEGEREEKNVNSYLCGQQHKTKIRENESVGVTETVSDEQFEPHHYISFNSFKASFRMVLYLSANNLNPCFLSVNRN